MKKNSCFNPHLRLLLAWMGLCACPLADAAEKPNIIVILADDLGWNELGCYGQKKIRTPNLDQLAAEGQRWTQFYSGAPTCAPSRNVLLTGRHTGGVSVQDLKRADPKETLQDLRGDWPMAANTHTLHKALADSGYTTSAFGKWGMGEYGTSGAPDRQAVGYFYGYTDHRMCHTFYPPFLWKNGIKQPINDPSILGHIRQPEGEVKAETYRAQRHASDAILEEALGFLDSAAKTARPFFMYYCPLEPHVAMQPPQTWVDTYPVDWDAEPYRGDKGYLPHPRPRAAYAATISFLDDNIGRLIRKLKETGAEQNTLIIFTSDNGTTHDAGGVDHHFFNSVSTLRGLKGQLHEGGIRVPTIMWWPGKVKAAQVVDQPGYSADLMPTLCALTGADPGKPYGENLLPVILGERKALEERKPMVWTGGAYGGQVAVRIGNMKAMRRQLFTGNKNGPLDWEVYDLTADRDENHNIASARPEIVEEAKAVLKREYTRSEPFRELALFAPETGLK